MPTLRVGLPEGRLPSRHCRTHRGAGHEEDVAARDARLPVARHRNLPVHRGARQRRQEHRARADAEPGLRPQELQPAPRNQQDQHQATGADLEHQRDERPGRAGRADDLRRRDVRDQRQMDLRARRGNGPADLADAGGARAGHAGRADHARGGNDLQRQAVPRDVRQPRARARHEDRRAGLEPEVRRREGRLLRDRRADRRQRGAHLRHGRRRIDHPRVPRRLGSRDRQEVVAPLHDSVAWRAWLGDLAEGQRRLDARRCADVALRLVRSGARSRVLGNRQRGAVRSEAAGRARQPVRVQRAGDPAEDRRSRLLFPVHAQ